MSSPVENTLKLVVATFSCNLLRAIITYVSLLFIKEDTSIEEWNSIKIAAITLSSIILTIVSMCILLYDYRQKSLNNECGAKASSYILPDIIMLLSVWFYFVGNNLTSFYTTRSEGADDYREASQILLLIGFTGFIVVPRLEDFVIPILQKYNILPEFNSTNENNGTGFQQFVYESIAMLVKIDALYTIFTNLNVECSTAQKVMPWLLFLVIVIAVIPYLIFQVIHFVEDEDNKKNTENPCKVVLTAIVIGFLVASFLLSDNNQPLDCSGAVKCTIDSYSNSTAIPGPHCTSNSSLRLVMTGLSTTLYSIPMFVLFYTFIRNTCN